MHKGHQRHGKGSDSQKFKSIDRDCKEIAETLHCVFSVSNYSNIFNRTLISMLPDDDVGYFIIKATVVIEEDESDQFIRGQVKAL